MGDKNNGPQYVLIFIPKPVAILSYLGKREFAEMIKHKDFKVEKLF